MGIGITQSGRPLQRWSQSDKRGELIDIGIDGVTHSGPAGWWSCNWLNKSPGGWPNGVSSTYIVDLIRSPVAMGVEKLSAIRSFAVSREFFDATHEGFGDGGDKSSAAWTFHLTKGVKTGFHFDDKDSMNYQLRVINGRVGYSILHATNTDWEPELGQAVGQLDINKSTAQDRFVSGNVLFDATLFLQIQCESDLAVVECWAEGSDD